MRVVSEHYLMHLSAAAGPMLLRVSAAFGLAALACGAAALLDSRVLDNGHSVWLKPLRFCVAFGMHLLTVWWLSQLTRRVASADRWFGASAWLQAGTAIVEWLCIALQAARGVHSHFNYTTPLDSAIFTVMGLGTAVLMLGIVLMMAGLLRWPADTTATTAALIGLAIAVVGGLLGVWMVMPTPEQRLILETGQRLPWVGSALSAPASNVSLPFFEWDLRSGDWRVPHFMGLHALQAIPLLAWLHLRGGGNPMQVPAAMWAGAAAYALALACAIVGTALGRSVLDASQLYGGLVVVALAVFVACAASMGRRLIQA